MTDYSQIDYFANEDNFALKQSVVSVPVYTNTSDKSIVTIAIPTCQRARTLKDAIESALSQKEFDAFEVMVVDDNGGREDETERLMSSYRNHPKVSYYKNSKNLAMAGNFNRIFELAKTEYIVILHDDDILSPDYLRIIIPFVENHDADIVSVDSVLWDEANKPCPSFKNKEKASYVRMKPSYMFNLCRCLPTGLFIKKKVGLIDGGFDERFHPSVDYVFLAKAIFKYNAYKYQDGLMIYRWAENVSIKLEAQKLFIFVDHYFKLQFGKRLKYPKWFIRFVCRKDADIRYKRICEDFGEQQIILEGKRLKYPSILKRICYKIYDIIDSKRYRLGW